MFFEKQRDLRNWLIRLLRVHYTHLTILTPEISIRLTITQQLNYHRHHLLVTKARLSIRGDMDGEGGQRRNTYTHWTRDQLLPTSHFASSLLQATAKNTNHQHISRRLHNHGVDNGNKSRKSHSNSLARKYCFLL